MKTKLSNIQIGDKVMVRNHSDNIAHKAGDMEMTVCCADGHSFAVDSSCGAWWFYRDAGTSYAGNAEIIMPNTDTSNARERNQN
jgi:hypothetical protein